MYKKKVSLREKRKTSVAFESTYVIGDEITIGMDVYQLTIAANLTKTCSPNALNSTIQVCIFVFFV